MLSVYRPTPQSYTSPSSTAFTSHQHTLSVSSIHQITIDSTICNIAGKPSCPDSSLDFFAS